MKSIVPVATVLLASLLVAPTVGADSSPGVLKCITGPTIPEEPLYYQAWRCTLGGYAPEPVGAVTGCRVYGGNVWCDGGAVGLVEAWTGCEVEVPDGRC